jgi:fructoselysine-6-P-deglycase FrlB-like protein
MVGATVSNDLMLRDMRSQREAAEAALVETRERAATWAPDRIDRVLLAGSGDSWIAATAVEPLFRERWAGAVAAVPSLDASRYRPVGTGDLVVVLSVSGEVARTIEVAARARSAGASTLAITAGLASTLASTCDASFGLPAPIDRSIPHSRDYTAMLVTLGVLIERLTGSTCPELDELPVAYERIIEASLDAVGTDTSAPRTWFLGAGPDRASAMFGAMKFWEAAGQEAWWDDLEEFGHGSQLMARPGDRAVLIAAGPGMQRAQEMEPGLTRMGMDVVTVGPASMRIAGCDHFATTDDERPAWHPFVSCVPLQAMAYAQANAAGLDVAVPLDGRPYAAAYDEVHVEWTKESRVIVDVPVDADGRR